MQGRKREPGPPPDSVQAGPSDAAAFEDFQQSELMFVRERAERPYAEVVTRKLAQLDAFVGRLSTFAGVSADQYAADWLIACAVERTLELAIDACISLTRHTIAERRLGTPATFADVFITARRAGLIEDGVEATMVRMCGFRNRLVHEGDHLDPEVVVGVLRSHLRDFADFAEIARTWMPA